ncbi:unnamed protein product [Pleuronectes platessa]|uniref:Uncharacterized protein n=1 Tax=Pleuronectes platessa TaxID=8262 RepID=A0A9N7TTS6_PLEPL|nr:unnamed protein product [Pleuronectes platessa]
MSWEDTLHGESAASSLSPLTADTCISFPRHGCLSSLPPSLPPSPSPFLRFHHLFSLSSSLDLLGDEPACLDGIKQKHKHRCCSKTCPSPGVGAAATEEPQEVDYFRDVD